MNVSLPRLYNGLLLLYNIFSSIPVVLYFFMACIDNCITALLCYFLNQCPELIDLSPLICELFNLSFEKKNVTTSHSF
jgi:hypothetical protein